MICCVLLPLAAANTGSALGDALADVCERRAIVDGAVFLDLGPAVVCDPAPPLRSIGRIARAQSGQEPRLGLGANPFVARVAAQLARPGHGRVIRAEQTAATLAPLPIAQLPLSDPQRSLLRQLGLTTLGALAALPAGALLTQLGPDGARVHQLAQGIDPTPIPRALPAPALGCTRQLDPPVADRPTLAAILQRQAQALARRLAATGRAAQHLTLTLVDARARTISGAHTFAQPTADLATLTGALGALLARAPLAAGVTTLTSRLSGLSAARAEQRTLDLDEPARRRVDPTALRDLARRFGPLTFPRILPARISSHLAEERFVFAAGEPGAARP